MKLKVLESVVTREKGFSMAASTARLLLILALLASLLPLSCSGGNAEGKGDKDTPSLQGDSSDTWAQGGHYLAQLEQTLLLGSSDNAEVVKVVPGTSRALLVSSKARKAMLLEVEGDKLKQLREQLFFPNDPTESELTHIAVSPDGSWAVATRTMLLTDAGGAQTDCGGELVFFDASDSASFGSILSQVEVGPMPDCVAISDDGKWVASANERDGPEAWGKCTVEGETASISIVSLAQGPANAKEFKRITMIDSTTGPREPESVIFSKDNDLVVATLQDSHEVLFVRISDLEGMADPTTDTAAVKIVRLPDDDLGAGPWPDGVGRFVASDSKEYFVTAGEWNDTFAVLSSLGTVISNTAISPSDIPTALPRVIDPGSPRFSPDSVASFKWSGKPHIAFTLRHSGAIAVYDLSDPASPSFSCAAPVGEKETGGWDEDGSAIRPEGIDAALDGSFIITANEGESSVSLLLPAE